jgi:glycosyltransferase domain-containing protein
LATLEDITIYLPTINRPQYLERCLNFLSLYNERLNILIFDSSNIGSKNLNLDIITKYKFLNLNYIHENDIYIKFETMGQVCLYILNNYITTEFITFCGDDDFLFIHNLIPHMNFLIGNPDYIVCHGNIIMFKEENSELVYTGTSCSMDLPQEDKLERFIWYCFNRSSIQYGVIRTKDFLKVHKYCNDIKHKWLSSEVLPTILTVLYGKIKNLETISVLQEWEHSSITHKTNNKYNGWLFNMVNFDECWPISFSKMADVFFNEVKIITNKTDKEIYEAFENGFSYIFTHTYDSAIRSFRKKNSMAIEDYKAHHFPKFNSIGKTRISVTDNAYFKMLIKK